MMLPYFTIKTKLKENHVNSLNSDSLKVGHKYTTKGKIDGNYTDSETYLLDTKIKESDKTVKKYPGQTTHLKDTTNEKKSMT